MRELPDDTAKTYLLNATSLDAVLETKKLGISRTTLYRRIRGQAKGCPDWYELLEMVKGQRNWGSVIGIDTTCLKIRGVHYVYLHVADVTSGDPLVYTICGKEDAATIEPVLRQLKDLGYSPQIVVSDLAPELLISVKNVFPNAEIQGCIFHVTMWLDKELPTRKTIRKMGREKVMLWRKVKDIIKCICVAKNECIRQQYLEQLNRLNLDEKARNVIDRFSNNLRYFHTMDELKGYSTSVLYNNLCECHIGLIKRLKAKMRGFKSIEATRAIIKLFWFLKRKIPLPEEEGDALAYNMSLSSFCDCANLAELSKASGIPREVLNKIALKMGRVVVCDYVFTEDALKDIENTVLKMKEASLSAVMHKIGYDQPTTTELLERLGFSFLFKTLDPSDIIISPSRHE
jgi:transposase-like protein